MPKQLSELLAAVSADQIVSTKGDLSAKISAGVVESSRDVAPGGLFVARAGQITDGHQFIPEALAAGAAASRR